MLSHQVDMSKLVDVQNDAMLTLTTKAHAAAFENAMLDKKQEQDDYLVRWYLAANLINNTPPLLVQVQLL